jgi:signal transduction histidine kinase
VADTGIGIAPGDIAKVMKPFEIVESALARKYKGTGLGLPLAKRLVEMHGGTLEIDSTPGQGTTVTVRLPASRVVRTRVARVG